MARIKYQMYIVSLVGIHFLTVASQGCPSRWLERPGGDSCYRLWPSPLKTWDDARAACQAYDGDLLKLDSQEEKDWLIKEIIKYPAHYEWWIGLNNKEDLDVWVWIDGTPRNDTFILWGSGEPNNYRGEERCAEIWDNLLNDKNCRQPLQYICERRKDLPLTCDVENGWDALSQDSCFKMYDKEHTLDAAKLACSLQDASLVTDLDEILQKVITDFLKGSGQETAWLGLYYMEQPTRTEFDWQWESGKILTDNKWWESGRPSPDSVRNDSLNCVVLNATVTGYGNWQPMSCDGNSKYICMKPQGSCPDGWLQHQSTCFNYMETYATTWNEAKGSCNLQGASLPEITSSAAKLFIASVLANISPTASAWINWRGQFSDFNGTDMVKEDRLANDETGCAAVVSGSTSWQLVDCGELKSVMCTVPVNTPVIPPSNIHPQYECPYSWIKRDLFCYTVRYDAVSWSAARMECQQIGADLVVINDKEKYDYITDLVNQDIWIGLSDRGTNEKYVWLDTPFEAKSTKTFWKKSLLNGHVIGGRYPRNCVAMMNRQWVTYPCSFKLGYVCQKIAEYNIAPGKRATQSSLYEYHDAQRAIEGCNTRNLASDCCSHTRYEPNPWWEMDFGTSYEVGRIVIHRRYDFNCEHCKGRLHNFRLFLSNTSKTTDEKFLIFQDTRAKPPPEITIELRSPILARYLKIDIPDRTEYLTLCEVQVFQAKDIYSKLLSPANSNCFMDSMRWNGSISHTVTGRKCQKWARNKPHKHSYHDDTRYPEQSQVAANDYCRDPAADGAPWCYTLDPDTRWEYCGIPQCATSTDPEKKEETSNDMNCGAGWKENERSGSCYKTGRDVLCWADAVSTCEAFGGQLVVAQDENEYNFIKDIHYQDNFSLNSDEVWFGIHDTVPGKRWRSIDKDIDVSALPLSRLTGPVKNSNCIAVKTTDNWLTSFRIRDCLKRLPFICQRLGQYRKVYTGPSQKTVSLVDKNIIDLSKTDAITFLFKGHSSVTLRLEQTVDNIKTEYGISIASTMAKIQRNHETKYTSFEKDLLSASEFRNFWLSWRNGNLRIGRGSTIDSNLFMEWSDKDFQVVTNMFLQADDDNDGYWSFPIQKVEEPTLPFTASSGAINIALGKDTIQSSNYESSVHGAFKAVDGCKSTSWSSGCCTHTNNDFNPWWQINLGKMALIKEIVITRRWECEPCRSRMNGFRVFVTPTEDTSDASPEYSSSEDEPGPIIRIPVRKGTIGQFVKIDIPGRREYLTICEVEVFEDIDTDLPHCGPEWSIYRGGETCFRFVDGRRTWKQAQDYCSDIEGVLAPILSAEEQLYIFEKVRKFSAYGVWFNARRSSGDSLQFDNGTLLQYKDDLTFSGLWPGARGECFSLLLEWDYGNGMWVDFDCSVGMAFVCAKSERELTTTTSMTITTTPTASTTVPAPQFSDCPDGWLKNDDRNLCFLIVREYSDWYTANEKCTAKNGKLAEFLTRNDQRYFNDMFHTYHITTGDWDCVWIDGRDLKEGEWKLTSGKPLPAVLEWFTGQPDDFQHNEDCLASMTSFERAGKLNDASCSSSLLGYICQSAPLACEDGWTEHDITGHCYKIFQDDLNWHESLAACEAVNANLASIQSKEDQVFITGLLLGIMDIGVWIGAHDITTEAMWTWSDGQPWVDDNIRWAENNPDNWQGVEDCGMLRTLEDRGSLNDLECTYKIPYMCKKKVAVQTIPSLSSTTASSTFESTPATTTSPTTTTTSTTTGTTSIDTFSANCGADWEESPYTEYCYQFNSDRKGFFDALKTCIDQDAMPLSIVTAEEQIYINGRITADPTLSCDFWIGLTTDIPGWLDNSPLVYFNWAPGEPNSEIMGAAALSKTPDSHRQWKIRPDTDQLCYICKRERLQASNLTTAAPTSTILPDAGYFGCQGKGWVEYNSFCYFFLQEQKDWKSSLEYCRTQGGDLASISDKQENDFIYSQLPKEYCFNIWKNDTECNKWAESGECGRNPTWMARQCHLACNYCYHDCRDKYASEKCMKWTRMGECDANPKWMHPNCAQSCGICYGAPTRGFWIGMTKLPHSQEYTWSDLSRSSFTLWSKRQPTNIASPKPSCVSIFLQTGTWNDGFCTDLLSGLICKKAKSLISTTQLSPFKAGCSGDNSFGYEQFCYTYVQQQASWTGAEDACVAKGGHLAAVTDRFIQAFVSSELVRYNEDYWIGLRDTTDKTQLPSWSTGQGLAYTHFSKDVTAGLELYTPDVNKYQNVKIDVSDAESVVFEVEACNDAHILLKQRENDEDGDIYEIVIGGWKNTRSVIRDFKQQMPPVAAIFHNPLDCSASKNFWVSWSNGRIRVGTGVTVDSGEFMAYVDPAPSQVNYIAVATGYGSAGKWTFDLILQTECYAVSSSKPVGLWKPLQCRSKLPYICQTLREGYTTPPSTTVPPTTPVPCPDPWKAFGNFCYLVSKDGQPDSWIQAENTCGRYGGNLASIHSDEEAGFLTSLFEDHHDTVYTVWIGINDRDFEDSFIWTDGTSVSYQSWAYNEPNNVNGEEHCGELVLDTQEWNDNLCPLSRHYVCKVPRGLDIPKTIEPLMTTSDGLCDENWIYYKSFCYFNSQNDLKSWHQARQYCVDNGADLASIHDQEENFFLTTHVSKNSESSWLGLNDLNLDGSFQWTDGTAANYFLWHTGEPNDYQGSEKCVDMKPGNGRWNDLNCYRERAFICKRPAGDMVATKPATTIAPSGGCYPGFTPFGFQCYYVSEGKQVAWAEAKDECEQFGMGSRLASIHSQLEQAYLTTQIFGKSTSYWIGLNDLDADNSFEWVDNWPLAYTNWDKYAPRQQHTTQYPCVAMVNSEDSRPGVWNNFQCYLNSDFVCVAPQFPNLPTVSPTPPPGNSDCKSGYRSFGDWCYKLASQKQTWYQGKETCKKEEAELVSITNYYEQAFIQVLIADESEPVWIGLTVATDGTFSWTDKSEASIMLLDFDSRTQLTSCGAIQGHSWAMKDCQLMQKTVCKLQKERETTSAETPSTTLTLFRYVCNENYVSYNDSCYFIVTKDVKDFLGAQDACKDVNMTLASIHSKDENDYIQQILGEKVRNEVIQAIWIGLKKVQWKAGDIDHAYFLWTDGSPVTYLDQPTSDRTADDFNIQYGYMEYKHHWVLSGFSKKLGYICKGKPDVIQWLTTSTTPTPTTPTTTLPTTTAKTTRWPLYPFSNRVTPKLPPIHQPVRLDSPDSEETGLSGGQITGIIIGILGFLFIASVLVYVILKNWKPTIKYKIDTSLGFDNALFHKTNDTVSLNE